MSDEPLDELVQYARRLTADGLVVGTAGNISIRLGDEIVITPTSIPYERIERRKMPTGNGSDWYCKASKTSLPRTTQLKRRGGS